MLGSGVGLEAENLTLPWGGTGAGRLRGIGTAMCWRCGVLSRKEECVFFHREINNSPGMSGLPASGEGLVLASQGLPAAVVSGHGACSEPACRGRGHHLLWGPLVSVALPHGQAVGALQPWGRSCLPSWGAFSCLPQQGLIQKHCLEHTGVLREGISILPGSRSRAGIAAILLGHPWNRIAPYRAGSPPLQCQTFPFPLQGPCKGSTAKSWGFPSLCLPPSPDCSRGWLRAQGGSAHPCQLYPTLLGTEGLPSPMAGCNKLLAPTSSPAVAMVLQVQPHARNSKGAMWVGDGH